MSSVIQVNQVYYPESDGKPMGETDDHRTEIFRHIEMLEYYFRGQKVYVSGDLLVYYEQGNPRKFVVPDTFVVKGIIPRSRRNYKIWIERKAPDVVIETTSRKTRRKDVRDKPELYARLGVKEYFVFDPHLEYLDPPLQGYRLREGRFERIEPDATDCLESQELGLLLRTAERRLVFERQDTGERLLTAEERADREAEARQREAEARQREAAARLAAEAEVARLRAELARRPPMPE
jgi:Uma2 family endonuclease